MLKVPSEQLKLVPPAAPVQLVAVVVPAVTSIVGAPVSCIPDGRVSDTTTSSASARPGPALLRTVTRKVKGSRRFTVPGVATLLATCTSARVRTEVFSLAALLPVLVSNPRPVSSDTTVALLVPVPLATPRPVMVITRLWPAGITGKVQVSVPPRESTTGTTPQVPSNGTTCDRYEMRLGGIVSVTTTFSAAEGPMFETVMV